MHLIFLGKGKPVDSRSRVLRQPSSEKMDINLTPYSREPPNQQGVTEKINQNEPKRHHVSDARVRLPTWIHQLMFGFKLPIAGVVLGHTWGTTNSMFWDAHTQCQNENRFTKTVKHIFFNIAMSGTGPFGVQAW